MEKLHFTIVINAPKEKVWSVMLDDQAYREWTSVFSAGSYYKGDWSKGSKMLFIGPDPVTGEEGGMVARVLENKPYEFISLQHYRLYKNGVEDTTSEETQKWAKALENYTFNELEGGTEVVIDLQGEAELAAMFNDIWPKALAKLKEIAEKS